MSEPSISPADRYLRHRATVGETETAYVDTGEGNPIVLTEDSASDLLGVCPFIARRLPLPGARFQRNGRGCGKRHALAVRVEGLRALV